LSTASWLPKPPNPQPLNREVPMHTDTTEMTANSIPREPWYKYGVAVLLLEMLIAVAVCGYSLYMTFHGLGGFPGKH
jgi:hypothetical protein